MNKYEKQYCWWKHEVIYHIYPQSFNDTDNDGTGDLKGIIRKLDYLWELGVGAVWLSPIYDSPLIDGDYDIKDYLSVNPVYGNMDDFKNLVYFAHKKGIKIIMDMVLNHTSVKHPWFIESCSSKDSAKRDWYIWHPGKNGKKPNNWITNFAQSAWTFHKETGEYYFHSFFHDQADLNWHNPEVKKVMSGIMEFWLDMGIDGFRFDVINMIYKQQEFENIHLLNQFFSNKNSPNRNQPPVYGLLKKIRYLLNSYPDKVSIGEIYTPPPGNSELVNSYVGDGSGMLHLAFDFSLIFTRFGARRFYKTIKKYYSSLPETAWPCFVISNHDLGRNIKPRFCIKNRYEKAKVLAAMLLTLKGTPFIYYGDEIGMENNHSIPRNELRDRYGKLFYPFYKGRDKARTPMQWNGNKHA